MVRLRNYGPGKGAFTAPRVPIHRPSWKDNSPKLDFC
jgi:hypothetical protein